MSLWGLLSHGVFWRAIHSDLPALCDACIFPRPATSEQVTHSPKVTAVFSSVYRRELTLIAGLAGESGVALALIWSYAVSMLAAGLAQSCLGGFKGEETDQCSTLEDYLYQIRTTKHLILLLF